MMATVLGDWGGFITSIATLLAVVAGVLQGRKNGSSISNVHELVNNRSQQQDRRIEQLTSTITDAGEDVPAKET